MIGGNANLLWTGILVTTWCVFHSMFVTHWWDRLVRRRLPGAHPLARLVYVVFSTLSFLGMMAWIRTHDDRLLWAWPGPWAALRWTGLAAALLCFWLGVRAYDNRAFLGLSQLRAWLRGRPAPEPPFRRTGVLGVIRHPWYTGSLLFFVFCLPVTDVNLVWRGVFFLYTLIGAQLEERKLLRDLGPAYAAYRRQVPRFFPRLKRPGRPVGPRKPRRPG